MDELNKIDRGQDLTVLWTRAQPLVRSYVRSVVRDAHITDDLLQQVALTLVEKFEQYDRSRNFTAWSMGIAKHKVMQYFDAQSRDRHRFDSEALAVVADAYVSVEAESADREVALSQCLRSLKAKAREVIAMRFERGMRVAAIASSLGISPNAVFIVLHRTRNELANCIERRLGTHGGRRMTDPTELISRYFDNGLSSEEFASLTAWLRIDVENARLFARRSLMEDHLCDYATYDTQVNLNDAMIVPAISDREAGDPATIPMDFPASPSTAVEERPPAAGTLGAFHRRRWRTAAAILLPLMLGIAGWMVFRQSGLAPAVKLARSVDVKWGSAITLQPGDPMPGKTLELTAGLAELQFASGTSVIVEGPARFHVRPDNAIELDKGRLSAVVPVPGHGFAVHTASATFVDLGTEFGVSVDDERKAELHVFKGTVAVTAHAANNAAPVSAPTTVAAGDAAVAAHGVLTVSTGEAAPQAFVRSLDAPASIDVVDLICGGDGATHRRSGGIDPRTGDSGLLTPVSTVDDADIDYHAVPKLQAIDGCFVPNGNMKIDSAGDTFDFGPTTGRSFYDVRAGGLIPWPLKSEKFTGVLGAVDYTGAGHAFVLIHPNCGITFDLAALRRLHPGLKIGDFQTVAGNSYTKQDVGDPVNLFVIVDGVSRFERRTITQADGAIRIDVLLSDSDRFVTLATTDHGSAGHDWIIIGDPQFE